jgi:hypothetical protein
MFCPSVNYEYQLWLKTRLCSAPLLTMTTATAGVGNSITSCPSVTYEYQLWLKKFCLSGSYEYQLWLKTRLCSVLWCGAAER